MQDVYCGRSDQNPPVENTQKHSAGLKPWSSYENGYAELQGGDLPVFHDSFYLRHTSPTVINARTPFIPFQTDHKSTNNFWEEFFYI